MGMAIIRVNEDERIDLYSEDRIVLRMKDGEIDAAFKCFADANGARCVNILDPSDFATVAPPPAVLSPVPEIMAAA